DGVLPDQPRQHRQAHWPVHHRRTDQDPGNDPVVAVTDLFGPLGRAVVEPASRPHLLPARVNSVSSMTTLTASSAGTSNPTTSLASSMLRRSGNQRAAEKNLCARSCDHSRTDQLPPASRTQS